MIITKYDNLNSYLKALEKSLMEYQKTGSPMYGYDVMRGVENGALKCIETDNLIVLPYDDKGWYEILRCAKKGKIALDTNFKFK